MTEQRESGGGTIRNGDEGTEEWTSDVHSYTPTQYASITLNTELLRAEMTNDEVDIGFELLRDGQHLGFSAGTVDPLEEGPTIRSYHSLTLEEARELHETLGEAIEEAEEVAGDSDEAPDHKSMIQRLKEAI